MHRLEFSALHPTNISDNITHRLYILIYIADDGISPVCVYKVCREKQQDFLSSSTIIESYKLTLFLLRKFTLQRRKR